MQNAIYYGINPPFVGGSQSILSIQTDERLIKNDLIQMLLTRPGERVYRPTFGTGLRDRVFENMDAGSLSTLEAEISQQIDTDERVIVNQVTATLSPDGQQLNVLVNVSPTWARLTNYIIEIGLIQGGQIEVLRQ
jgi:phage baseplate assembly protein W